MTVMKKMRGETEKKVRKGVKKMGREEKGMIDKRQE